MTQKRTLIIFLIFAEDFALLSRNIIKVITFMASNSEYKKSNFSVWLYKGKKEAGDESCLVSRNSEMAPSLN